MGRFRAEKNTHQLKKKTVCVSDAILPTLTASTTKIKII